MPGLTKTELAERLAALPLDEAPNERMRLLARIEHLVSLIENAENRAARRVNT